jgi:hypothetical protein
MVQEINKKFQNFENIKDFVVVLKMRTTHIATCISRRNVHIDRSIDRACIYGKYMKTIPRMNQHLNKDLYTTIFSVHAEINAIVELLKTYKIYVRKDNFLHMRLKKIYDNIDDTLKRKISKLSILVIRISKDNKLINSKPCDTCKKIIDMYGFNSVIYSV